MSKDSIINEIKLMLCNNQYTQLKRFVQAYKCYKSNYFSKCKYGDINMLNSSKFFDES